MEFYIQLDKANWSPNLQMFIITRSQYGHPIIFHIKYLQCNRVHTVCQISNKND